MAGLYDLRIKIRYSFRALSTYTVKMKSHFYTGQRQGKETHFKRTKSKVGGIKQHKTSAKRLNRFELDRRHLSDLKE